MIGGETLTLHASCVAILGRGLLIFGPSGTGKSSLALQLISLGARLVADDRVVLWSQGDALVASAPPSLGGLIEARGIGLLRAETLPEIPVYLAVDLGADRSPRLPEQHSIVFLQRRIDLVKGPLHAHLAAALLLYLQNGRVA